MTWSILVPEDLLSRLRHRLNCPSVDKLPDDVFDDGFDHGADIALRVLSYKQQGYTEQVRTGSEIPCRDMLPLDSSGRTDWLAGYISGIQGILHTWEMLVEMEET
jgi:hypothetical protein